MADSIMSIIEWQFGVTRLVAQSGLTVIPAGTGASVLTEIVQKGC